MRLDELELARHIDACADQPIKEAGHELWRTVASPPRAGQKKYVSDEMRRMIPKRTTAKRNTR